MTAGRGRRAALPTPGPATRRGLLLDGGRTVVRCFEEETGAFRDFDLTWLPVAPGLRDGLAAALERRTAPGKGPTRIGSFERTHRILLQFAEYVSTLTWPPTEVAHLAPEHVAGFVSLRSQYVAAPGDVGELKRLLRQAEGLSEAMLGVLGARNPLRAVTAKRPSYTAAEFERIAQAARTDLRAAAKRIRDNRAVLERLRAGEIDIAWDLRLWERMELLRWADEHADVPRHAPCENGLNKGRSLAHKWVFAHGAIDDTVCRLHLSPREIAAAVILMAVMTGENKSVLMATPAAHHRADGYTGATGVAITNGRKHRRGRRSHMDLVWSEIPDWISIPDDRQDISAKDELHTPFGLYMLIHELTARSRAMLGTDRLLVSFATRGGGRGLRAGLADGHVAEFGPRHGLTADEPGSDGEPVPLAITLDQLRLTHLEFHQKPVAHTTKTLASSYLGRNRGNLAEYQKVVAAALAEEVDKARVRAVMLTLTADDLSRAAQDAKHVAAEYGIDATTLKKMIAGQLDTVMNACPDSEAGLHGPAGEPCRASFIQCLQCPCARALPRHLPVQILVHDRLLERRQELTALAWARRFAGPQARLADILDQHGQAAVDDARDQITDADRRLVARFLNRDLDLR